MIWRSSIPNDTTNAVCLCCMAFERGDGYGGNKVFADEISHHLDKVPPIALNHPTAAALELRDGAELAIRFERDLRVSAISPDGRTRDLGLTTYGDSPLLTPGTVVAAKIVRPLAPKIHIRTELGEFVVNPNPAISQTLRSKTLQVSLHSIVRARRFQSIILVLGDDGYRSGC